MADKLAEDASVPSHIREAFTVRTRLVAAHQLFFNDSSSSKKRAGAPLEGPAIVIKLVLIIYLISIPGPTTVISATPLLRPVLSDGLLLFAFLGAILDIALFKSGSRLLVYPGSPHGCTRPMPTSLGIPGIFVLDAGPTATKVQSLGYTSSGLSAQGHTRSSG